MSRIQVFADYIFDFWFWSVILWFHKEKLRCQVAGIVVSLDSTLDCQFSLEPTWPCVCWVRVRGVRVWYSEEGSLAYYCVLTAIPSLCQRASSQ